MHKEIVHLFLLYVFVFLDKLTELFLDMSDDERINDIYLVKSNYFAIIIRRRRTFINLYCSG